jgi:hypothetical protein
MSIVRFLEIFIFRDLLSYFIPGILTLLGIAIFVPTIEFELLLHYKAYLGNNTFVIVAIICAYSLGYIGSSFLFWLRTKITFLDRPTMSAKIEPNLAEQLKFVFGDWTSGLKPKELQDYCLDFVQINCPDIYNEKIERRVTLRNYEVGMAFTSIIWIVLILIFLSAWYKLFAIIPISIMIILLVGSRLMDGEIDRLSLRLFFSVSKNIKKN